MNPAEQPERPLHELVIVGASAGGIEALSVLVETLPSGFPAPVVLAQHLDPARPSALSEILQRRTILPIVAIEDSTLLEPGTIYVIPSNTDVRIEDGHIVLVEKEARPHPSIDRLLTSAAAVYGDRLIAVVLTGSGGDGAVGAIAVKAAGGAIVIQNPHTARYASMPLAIPPSIVDFQVELDEIGPLLHDLLARVQVPERAEDVLREILNLVNRQANIDFRPYKTSTILRRISRRMAVTQHFEMRDYANYLAEHPEEVGELVNAFLINVTQFFRDYDAFAHLKDEILPTIVNEARNRDRVLRFWSAGCATGEEPYSLAVSIAEILGAELSQWNIRIFATDLDEAAIGFARRGVYTENQLSDVPPDYRERYFERAEYGYRISKTLRQMVIFGNQDLSRSAAFPRIDLVTCRNVLIYFTPALQEYVLGQFAFSLGANRGYLFLGKAETIRANQPLFEQVSKPWRVYRCTASALALPRRAYDPERALARRGTAITSPTHDRNPLDRPQESRVMDLNQLRRLTEHLLRFLPLGVAVIDRSYRVLTANGMARRLLGLREVGEEVDFLHGIRGLPYPQVRQAIDAVFRERSPLTLAEVELDLASGGSGHIVSFSIGLMVLEADAPQLAVISISDVTEQVQIRRDLEGAHNEQERLVTELASANQRLSEMNKELLDSNEELQVTNEEMMLTHEELQAALEEFEATNEELQATNEELETNNEELQATNEELQTTNEELRARTAEMQELMLMLESERTRLSDIVELAPFYVIVLSGSNLSVEIFKPLDTRLFEGRSIQGQPLEMIAPYFWGADGSVIKLAHEVYERDISRTTPRLMTRLPNEQGEMEGHYLVYTLVPIHDLTGRVNGVVIYGVDETELHAGEQQGSGA